MTLQTLAIALAGIVLGAQKGALSTLVYVLLGAVGIPVFAGFSGGAGILFGYTGGFILSFPLLALVVGIGAARNNKWWLWSGIVTGVMINYLCGLIYFSIYLSMDMKTSFFACILPFIPVDIIKILVVGFLGEKLKNVFTKGKLIT